MQLKVFSVRDAKAEVYNQPFFQKTHGEAERTFRQLANDQKSMINQYPDDFDLYYLGDFDDQTGLMTTLKTPQHIIKAVNCIPVSHLAPRMEQETNMLRKQVQQHS